MVADCGLLSPGAKDEIERLSVRSSLLLEELAARRQYRERAVNELLARIEDCLALVGNGYEPREALRMIECQCKRIRLIDAELNK